MAAGASNESAAATGRGRTSGRIGTFTCGSAADRSGSSSAAPRPKVPTRCRVAAVDRRIRRIATEVAAKTKVAFTARSNPKRMAESSRNFMSASLHAGLIDELREPVELVARELRLREIEERGHGFFRRAVEERLEDVRQGRPSGPVPRERGEVDVAGALGDVADMALVLEDPEQGPDRRVAGGVGESGEDLSGRGLAVPVEDFHDLPLPPGQVRERLLGSHAGSPPRMGF